MPCIMALLAVGQPVEDEDDNGWLHTSPLASWHVGDTSVKEELHTDLCCIISL